MSDFLESVIKSAADGQLSCAGLHSALEAELEKICAAHNDRDKNQTLLRCLEMRGKRFDPTVARAVSKIDQMRRESNFAVADHYDQATLEYLGKAKPANGPLAHGTTRASGSNNYYPRSDEAKPVAHAEDGDGKQHAMSDDFDAGLAAFHQANASLSVGAATEQFLRTPKGKKAYAELEGGAVAQGSGTARALMANNLAREIEVLDHEIQILERKLCVLQSQLALRFQVSTRSEILAVQWSLARKKNHRADLRATRNLQVP